MSAKRIRQVVAWSAAAMAGPLTVWAASDGHRVPELEETSPWLAVLYTAVCLAGVLVVGFKNSRRTHLD